MPHVEKRSRHFSVEISGGVMDESSHELWSVKACGKVSGLYGTIIIVIVWCSKRGNKVNVVVRKKERNIYKRILRPKLAHETIGLQ